MQNVLVWGRSQDRHDDGLQKASTTGLLTERDDEVLERSLEKPVKNGFSPLLGKGRGFKSFRPHQSPHT